MSISGCILQTVSNSTVLFLFSGHCCTITVVFVTSSCFIMVYYSFGCLPLLPHSLFQVIILFVGSTMTFCHQENHSKEEKHHCSKCEKTLHHKSDLQRHEKQVHKKRSAQQEYKCSTCGEVFHNMAPFQAHQKKAHCIPPTATKRSCKDLGSSNITFQFSYSKITFDERIISCLKKISEHVKTSGHTSTNCCELDTRNSTLALQYKVAHEVRDSLIQCLQETAVPNRVAEGHKCDGNERI